MAVTHSLALNSTIVVDRNDAIKMTKIKRYYREVRQNVCCWSADALMGGRARPPSPTGHQAQKMSSIRKVLLPPRQTWSLADTDTSLKRCQTFLSDPCISDLWVCWVDDKELGTFKNLSSERVKPAPIYLRCSAVLL